MASLSTQAVVGVWSLRGEANKLKLSGGWGVEGTVGGEPCSPSSEAGQLEETNASELNVFRPWLCCVLPVRPSQSPVCPRCAYLCHWEHGDSMVNTCLGWVRKRLCLGCAWAFRASVSFTLDVTGS